MVIVDVIKKGNQINLQEPSLFIANSDFLFNGIPILKDSLVYYNGKDEIKINLVNYGIFQPMNVPDLIHASLNIDDGEYVVDKASNCRLEETRLYHTNKGVWHINHFDRWHNSFVEFKERIKESREIDYNGIIFSSLMYVIDVKSNSIKYFISTKPFDLVVNTKVIHLPPNVEVSTANYNSFTIIPLDEMEYHGIKLKGVCSISNDGVLTGGCTTDLSAEIIKKARLKKIIVSKGTQIEITHDGQMFIGLFDSKTHKIHKYQLSLIDE